MTARELVGRYDELTEGGNGRFLDFQMQFIANRRRRTVSKDI
jgi:hypothetical protein